MANDLAGTLALDDTLKNKSFDYQEGFYAGLSCGLDCSIEQLTPLINKITEHMENAQFKVS